MNFTVNYQEQFQTNSAVRITNIRSKFHLCEQIINLNFFQKRAYCACSLSCRIPVLINVKAQFKPQLSRDLNTHSFYSVDEFLMFRMTPNLICDCIEGHSWQGEGVLSGAVALGGSKVGIKMNILSEKFWFSALKKF